MDFRLKDNCFHPHVAHPVWNRDWSDFLTSFIPVQSGDIEGYKPERKLTNKLFLSGKREL